MPLWRRALCLGLGALLLYGGGRLALTVYEGTPKPGLLLVGAIMLTGFGLLLAVSGIWPRSMDHL